jgi:hypothetical protein
MQNENTTTAQEFDFYAHINHFEQLKKSGAHRHDLEYALGAIGLARQVSKGKGLDRALYEMMETIMKTTERRNRNDETN